MNRPSPRDRHRRLVWLAVGLGAGFLAVALQVAHLQLLIGDHLASLSDRNRIRLRPLAAPRGVLFDRHGLPLAENRPAFTVSVLPREAENLAAVGERVADLVGLRPAEVRERLARVPPDSPTPVRLARGLTLAAIARLEEWRLDLPGVMIEV